MLWIPVILIRKKLFRVQEKVLDKQQSVKISVVDPNTLNLDPNPGFGPKLNPDSGPDPGLF